MSEAMQPPKFCSQCGAELPPGEPRFCVECGKPVRSVARDDQADAPAATGPTVRLANAAGEQAVVGGTIKLPTDAAIPPGLWFAPQTPDAERVLAVYVPLRAVVNGWSGRVEDGWEKVDQRWANDGSSRELVSFAIRREWFAAPGAAEGLRLQVFIGASSYAEEGRTRRGFRYRSSHDPPMMVLEAYWSRAGRAERQLPVPQIQLMAPPRVPRISDLAENIGAMDAREADLWAREGSVAGLFRLLNFTQQRTPVGRGLVLFEIPPTNRFFAGLLGRRERIFRLRIKKPLPVARGQWQQIIERINSDAALLGLDLGSDAMIEWWLEREGYDGALFEERAHTFGQGRVAIAFRRAQVVEVTA
ncbi:zinc ribbon domain-containing protein [Candidatus Gracilibacteria bacterium]|nr:zinc ribbon domain-containing protein [Candidatus Gracilibacteria bacterium]